MCCVLRNWKDLPLIYMGRLDQVFCFSRRDQKLYLITLGRISALNVQMEMVSIECYNN